MNAPTVIMQTVMVLAVCWLMIDQVCEFVRGREQRQLEEATAKGLDILVAQGSVWRAL